METELRFPEDKAPYRVAAGCRVVAKSEEDARAVSARLQGAMTPTSQEDQENRFYALRLATAGAAKSEVDEEARMVLYLNTLGAYPADVFKAVFDHFATMPRADATAWFPTLPEMVAEAERLVGPRRATVSALLAWRPKSPEQIRDEAVRANLIQAKALKDEGLLCRRSAPDRSAELLAQAKALEAEAREMRTGPLS